MTGAEAIMNALLLTADQSTQEAPSNQGQTTRHTGASAPAGHCGFTHNGVCCDFCAHETIAFAELSTGPSFAKSIRQHSS